ncbi:MAG: adenosylcobalamin-dependent ribonucleoside-diphosphate reductase [Nanoarchaeota archaeon]|nr:adenosylcobalamin-dependent ribonucleoside-diphosphate reductase [Nanoarchaeota archaeon]
MGKDLADKLDVTSTIYKTALEESTKYFKGDEMAAKNFIHKYALKDSEGNLYETNPRQMHERLADEIVRIEQKYPNPLSKEEVLDLLDGFKYIVPQGGPMAVIGNNYQISSLSNCFVIGPKKNNGDSYGGILKIDQEQVQLMKRRGGVGHDLSHIRPKGSPVKNSALTSTGIVPFMERYSNSTREVAQDGRRGALMLTVSIKHPDSEDFIDAKMEKEKVTGANVSVKIDDEFMRAVVEDKPYIQQYPIDSDNPQIKKEINARELWNKIIHNAWKSAEPGVLFWDTVQKESVPDSYKDLGFETVSTNPCGEIPLCPYDSCRLLANNLYGYVENPFTPEARFNEEKFKRNAHYAQRIMDDIIDLEIEKIDRILEKIDSDKEDEFTKSTEKNLWVNIREKAVQGRRSGIGVTAEGDMLAAMGLTYGTPEATEFAAKVHKMYAVEVYRSSVDLAEERGAFPIYDAEKEKDNPFIQRIAEAAPEVYEKMKKVGRRNIALLTIAPTGTVSQMTQTTSGVEPAYMVAYKRRRKVNPNDKNVKVSFVDEVGDSWEEYNVFHHKFEDWLRINNYDVAEVKNMSDEDLDEVIKKSPYHKATSNDVDWVEKVRMQGEIQKWIDHSISATTNMPKDVSEEIVGQAYMKAWESGAKGMTIYRDGSREGVLIARNNDAYKKGLLKRLDRERPKFVVGLEELVKTPYEYDAFVTLQMEMDEKGNVLGAYGSSINIGTAGDDMNAMAKGFEEALSLVLQAGVDYRVVANQLIEIGKKNGEEEKNSYSLPDSIGRGMIASANKQLELSKLLGAKDLTDEILKTNPLKRKMHERLNRERPMYVGGLKEKIKTPHGKSAFVGVNWEMDESGKLIEPYETFVGIGKGGSDINFMAEGLGRVISIGLKAGIPYQRFSEKLIGISGETQTGIGPGRITSLSDAIGKGISASAEKAEKTSGSGNGDFNLGKKKSKPSGNLCPNCGSPLIRKEGCWHCIDKDGCGYSKC